MTSKPKPKPGKGRVAAGVEGACCAVCGSALSRDEGSLMCSNRSCVAYRGKEPVVTRSHGVTVNGSGDRIEWSVIRVVH